MKLDIQMFGGRGASSQKQFSTKDIRTLKETLYGYGNRTKGYELNGWYLLKDYGESLRNSSWYSWIITKNENATGQTYIDKRKMREQGNYIYVNNFKEGKEKLLELANKKRK